MDDMEVAGAKTGYLKAIVDTGTSVIILILGYCWTQKDH